MRVWTDLLAHEPWSAHRDLSPPGASLFGAAIALTLLGGTAAWSVLRATRSRLPRIALLAVGGGLVFKEAFLATSGLGWFERASLLSWPGVLALAAGAAAAGLAAQRLGLREGWLGRRLAMALLPFALLTLGNAVWRVVRPPAPRVERFDDRAQARTGTRVVWLIFDELDEDVAFVSRPAGVKLPALDRFRAEAQFVARQAESPANATAVSIPQLVSPGGRVADSVFARARTLGLRSGIAGWAVPYCQLFQGQADVCQWWPMPQQHNSYGRSVSEAMAGMAVSVFESNQFSPFGQSRAVRKYVRTVEEMTGKARELAARADLDFVYLHIPPPHNPYMYDPVTGRMDVVPRAWSPRGYLNNLALADRIFGEIRASMEKAGVWERSIVLVTADHGFRSKHRLGFPRTDRHVPFMVKSARAVELDPNAPLKTAETADLLLRWAAPQS